MKEIRLFKNYSNLSRERQRAKMFIFKPMVWREMGIIIENSKSLHKVVSAMGYGNGILEGKERTVDI